MRVAAKMLLAAAALVIWPAMGEAAIWRVELDGSGDFESIQDAVDAAEPGDTILVGPGRFDEFRLTPINNFSAVIYVYKSGLTVQGAGVGETIIGTGLVDWYRPPIIGDANGVDSFTLQDVRVTGGYECIYYGGHGLTVERCELGNSTGGMSLFSSNNFTVRDSRFLDVSSIGIISFGHGASNGLIERCEFVGMIQAIVVQRTSNVRIADCVMTEVDQAIQYDGSNAGEISRCRATGIPGWGYGVGVGVIAGSQVTMIDCEIDWSMTNAAALTVRAQGVLSGHGNILRGGGGPHTIRVIGPQAFQGFHGNEIYPSVSYSVVALYSVGSLIPPVHLDMTGNYWGTDDAEQIAAWIEDYHDHPDHVHYRMIVDYIPFEASSVGTVPASLSEVKDRFR
jgi:hypothetical protein